MGDDNYIFLGLIDTLGFVQGTLLGLILIFSYKRNQAIPLLGIFLFAYSFDLILSAGDMIRFFENHPAFIYLPFTFYWLFLPVLFLYVKAITHQLSWKTDWRHFILGGVEFIIFSILFLFPAATKLAWLDDGTADFIDTIHIIITAIILISYSVLIIRFINNYGKNIAHFYSTTDGKTLKWVKWICYYFLMTAFVFPIFSIVLQSTNIYFVYVMSIINVIFIFWVALNGFKQTFISTHEFIEKAPIPSPISSKMEHNDKAAIANDALLDTEFQQLQDFMTAEKPFIQEQLTIADLAKSMNISIRHLSNLINQKAGVNFKQFINHYRIIEAKRILKADEFSHLNMMGIAFEAGFTSKSNFYAAFKQETGMTPAKFQKAALPT